MLPDTTTLVQRDLVVALAARNPLPAVVGGLMAYSISVVEAYRLAANYVDIIPRGAQAADLPVQAPTKYETLFNLKTARSLGIGVSHRCSSAPTSD